MIIGTGTDLTAIDRIKRTFEKQGDRFLNRIYTETELNHVRGVAGDNADLLAAGLAKRWAAKEAAAKALGLGIRDGIYMKDFGVENDDQGRPSLVLSGGALERLQHMTPAGMVADVHISLSDDYTDKKGYALAFVVISARQSTG